VSRKRKSWLSCRGARANENQEGEEEEGYIEEHNHHSLDTGLEQCFHCKVLRFLWFGENDTGPDAFSLSTDFGTIQEFNSIPFKTTHLDTEYRSQVRIQTQISSTTSIEKHRPEGRKKSEAVLSTATRFHAHTSTANS
jgi:hypothetical protein